MQYRDLFIRNRSGADAKAELRLEYRFERLGHCRGSVFGSSLPGFSLAEFNTALEKGSIFDADAGSEHVTHQRTFGANFDAVGCKNISANLAQYNDFPGGNAGNNLAISAHRNAIAGKVDVALDLAVDKQRLGAADIAFDEDALANDGLITDGSHAAANWLNSRGGGKHGFGWYGSWV